MKSFYIVALTLATLASVFGEVWITQPIQSTKWSFGKSEKCTWDAKGSSGSSTLELFYDASGNYGSFQGAPIYTTPISDLSSGSATVDLVSINLFIFDINIYFE